MLLLLDRWLKHAALEVQEYVYLTQSAFRGVFTRPIYRYDIVEQFDLIGAGSLTVVLLSGLFTGAALASQSGLTLDQFGARPLVGRLVSASMIKELGPVLTALMLTGRIGSGIAAELGSMVVTDQINALRALGTDPVRKLVVPRVLAGLFMAPVLTVISDFIGAFSTAGELRAVLVVHQQGALHAGHLDGGHQAVRVRVHHRDDRLSRRPADHGRHRGRGEVDHRIRRRRFGRRDRGRFFRDTDLFRAVLLGGAPGLA